MTSSHAAWSAKRLIPTFSEAVFRERRDKVWKGEIPTDTNIKNMYITINQELEQANGPP